MIPYNATGGNNINPGLELGPALLQSHQQQQQQQQQLLHQQSGVLPPSLVLGKRSYGETTDYPGSTGGVIEDPNDNRQTPKKKGRKKSFIWAHVVTDEVGKVHCKHCSQLIRVNYGEKVERLRKHFVKSCPKSPFHKDSKEYEELLEQVNAPQMEHKKKSYIPQAAGKSKSNRVISYSVGFVATLLAGPCMELSPEQIQRLEANGNRSTSWAGVKLTGATALSYDASLDRIRGCNFSGNIYIGVFIKSTSMEHGITVSSGLYNSNFSGTCVLADNCYIFNTSMVFNVFVGRNSCIVNCAMVICEGQTSYGTQRSICVGPESDSLNAQYARSIALNINSTYYDVCLQALSVKKLLDLTDGGNTGVANSNNNGGNELKKTSSLPSSLVNNNPSAIRTGGVHQLHNHTSHHMNTNNNNNNNNNIRHTQHNHHHHNDDFVRYDMTIICDDVEISSCAKIRNTFLGSYSKVSQSLLDNTTLLSHVTASGSELTDCVVHNSCTITSKALLDGVLMFPHSHVSQGAIVRETVLGPDSAIAVGECKRCLIGPFVGFHHQALLIASCWPLGRGNIGYGCMIGANHTGRSNDQECLPGEGVFFGLGCAVQFPFSMIHSPYSLIAAGTHCQAQKIAFPFSLLADSKGVNVGGNTLRPGWILWSSPYFIERSLSKFQKRRKSIEYRTDFPIFRPSVIDLVLDARMRLLQYKQSLSSTNNSNTNNANGTNGNGNGSGNEGLVGAGRCLVLSEDLDRAIDGYSIFLHRYLLHGLVYLIAMGDTCRLPPPLAANMTLSGNPGTGSGAGYLSHHTHSLPHTSHTQQQQQQMGQHGNSNSNGLHGLPGPLLQGAQGHLLLTHTNQQHGHGHGLAGIEVSEVSGVMDSDSEDEEMMRDAADNTPTNSTTYPNNPNNNNNNNGMPSPVPMIMQQGNSNNTHHNNNNANANPNTSTTSSSNNNNNGNNNATVNPATVGPLAFVLEDIRRLEIPIGTIEEFLQRHDSSRNPSMLNNLGMSNLNNNAGPNSNPSNNPTTSSSSSSAVNANTTGGNGGANASQSVLTALLGRTGNASCLLSDSHDYSVRHHQLVHLQDEFPEIDFVAFLEQCSKGGYIAYTNITAQYSPLIKQLLVRLVDIERQYAEQVRTCKHKDFLRASEVIVGMSVERNEIDETILRAHTRAEDMSLVVHRIINQL